MAMLPYILDDLMRPIMFDQNFGLGLLNDDLFAFQPRTSLCYYRPWRRQTSQQSGMSSLTVDKDKFQVKLDVQQFTPEEVTVKVVDKVVVVEGKHEEKEDEHGFVSRHFVRRYVLPDDVDIDKVQSQLSSDGVLDISVPRKVPAEGEQKERVVPITLTNAPAVKAKQHKEEVKAPEPTKPIDIPN